MTEKVPICVEFGGVIVIDDDPPAVTDVGLNVAVAPEGRPLAERLTVWAEPEVTAVDTVAGEIGRASCRERLEVPGVGEALQGIDVWQERVGSTSVEAVVWM